MKIVTADEMRGLDAETFTRLGVPSRAIMEVAGFRVASFIAEHLGPATSSDVVIIAGPGNNGGDGYVVARYLRKSGISARVISTIVPDRLSGDARLAFEAWKSSGGETTNWPDSGREVKESAALIASAGVVVDAIYGTGFHGELDEKTAAIVVAINTVRDAGGKVVAIDVPTGVDSTTGRTSTISVQATTTIALQCLKVGHVLFPGSRHCGNIVVAEIGIETERSETAVSNIHLISTESAAASLRIHFGENAEKHKGGRGHVLVVGGSAGHYGAPKMSALAALKAGAGLVTLLLPKSGSAKASKEVLELMCASLPESSEGDFSAQAAPLIQKHLTGKDALIVGPGLGVGAGSAAVLDACLRSAAEMNIPMVIDADGLNILAKCSKEDQQKFKMLFRGRAIITPHPGEMARLIHAEIDGVQEDRLGIARRASSDWNCTTVLKGARTIIAGVERREFVNPAATEVLATAGSGDVLSGIIGALCARGYEPLEASKLGVFVHGHVGELLEARGGLGVIASNLIDAIPEVLNYLSRFKPPVHRLLQQALPTTASLHHNTPSPSL